jgi:protein-S-isoprenylcysteine O-methyltransferase Ste14
MRIRLTWLFALTMIALILVTQSAWEHNSPLVAELLFVAATLLVGIAVMGRLWCSVYIAGHKKKTLITYGPYSLCRNPLYFFSFLGAIGVGCATETLTIPAIIAIVFAAYYPRVIRREETALAAIHGLEYDRYVRTVPRFFPQLKEVTETNTSMSNPIVLRRHLASAIWFIWFLGIAELVEAFHEAHYLPVWIAVY